MNTQAQAGAKTRKVQRRGNGGYTYAPVLHSGARGSDRLLRRRDLHEQQRRRQSPRLRQLRRRALLHRHIRRRRRLADRRDLRGKTQNPIRKLAADQSALAQGRGTPRPGISLTWSGRCGSLAGDGARDFRRGSPPPKQARKQPMEAEMRGVGGDLGGVFLMECLGLNLWGIFAGGILVSVSLWVRGESDRCWRVKGPGPH